MLTMTQTMTPRAVTKCAVVVVIRFVHKDAEIGLLSFAYSRGNTVTRQ